MSLKTIPYLEEACLPLSQRGRQRWSPSNQGLLQPTRAGATIVLALVALVLAAVPVGGGGWCLGRSSSSSSIGLLITAAPPPGAAVAVASPAPIVGQTAHGTARAVGHPKVKRSQSISSRGTVFEKSLFLFFPSLLSLNFNGEGETRNNRDRLKCNIYFLSLLVLKYESMTCKS